MNAEKCPSPYCCFATTTWAACILGGLFVLFLFFEATTIRWWLMLPLAIASFVLFHIQRGQTSGLEKKVCDWGYWIVLVTFILRDMCISGQLVAAYQRMTEAGIPLHG